MKILQLIPQFPFPANDGGKIGISNIYYEFLNSNIDVVMIAVSQFVVKQDDIDKYKSSGEIKVIVKDTKNTTFRIIKNFLLNKSLYIEKHYSKDLASQIESLVNINDFDIIHSDHTNMGRIGLELAKKYDKVFGLRLHNIEYMIWKRYYDELPRLSSKRLFIGQQYKILKRLEADLISQSDVSFAITSKDRERALEISPNANIVVASAGVNLDEFQSDTTVQKVKNSLIIATTFNWIHNINALKWFIENVQPDLHKEFQDLKLSIIGKNPPSFFNDFNSIGVSSLGYVDDVKPYLDCSEIYIAPLFVGSGIRIKILEAMAMKLPVVATDISAEGIEAGESEGLFRANTKEEYVNSITKLLQNRSLRKDLGNKAREFISKNHSWKENINTMLINYQSLVSSKKSKA